MGFHTGNEIKTYKKLNPVKVISVSSNNAGDSYAYGGGQRLRGQTISLYAQAGNGYQFDHWEDENGNSVSSNQTYTFTVGDEDRAFRANFIESSVPQQEEWCILGSMSSWEPYDYFVDLPDAQGVYVLYSVYLNQEDTFKFRSTNDIWPGYTSILHDCPALSNFEENIDDCICCKTAGYYTFYIDTNMDPSNPRIWIDNGEEEPIEGRTVYLDISNVGWWNDNAKTVIYLWQEGGNISYYKGTIDEEDPNRIRFNLEYDISCYSGFVFVRLSQEYNEGNPWEGDNGNLVYNRTRDFSSNDLDVDIIHLFESDSHN